MSAEAIVARVRPDDFSLFARAPVKCATSGEQYFGLIELRGGVATMLGRCPPRAGKPPICMPLPRTAQRFATVPDFVCPGCGGTGGGLFIPATEPRGDLLHSCFAPYRPGACGCGTYAGIRYVDCLPSPSFRVRGELVDLAGVVRFASLLPSSGADRVPSGGARGE
jgi:hypothetical protein